MLNKPYPIPDNKRYAIYSSLFIGFAAYLFIIVFQPFGTDQWHHPYKFLLLSVYGLITSSTLIAEYFLFSGRLKDEKKWTVKKELFKYAIVFIVCSLLCYGYNMVLFPRPFILKDFFYMFFIVFSVSILIFSNYIFINYFILINKYSSKSIDNLSNPSHSKEAFHNNYELKGTQTLHFSSDNQKDEFSISEDQFIFAETADNYIKVHYIIDGELSSKMTRNTLSKTIKDIETKRVKRCHRSYIVNLAKVENLKGNAQGYRLFIKGYDDFIPVSRSYIPKIIPFLSHLV